jgi:hypothetical protein
MTGSELANMDMVDVPGFSLTAEEYARKEKALVRRVDFRLMPCLLGMIVLNYLDRNALPNARIQGIEKDLGLKGDQFNTASLSSSLDTLPSRSRRTCCSPELDPVSIL